MSGDGTAVDPSTVTVRCHVRPSMVHDEVERHLEALRTAAATGTIGGLDVQTWPGRVVVDDDGPHEAALAAFERFDGWAAAHDTSIRPPFRVRTVTSPVSDGVRRVLATPVCCLSLTADERLLAVYPHATDGATRTVSEAVAALGAGTLPQTPAPAGGESSRTPARPPDPTPRSESTATE